MRTAHNSFESKCQSSSDLIIVYPPSQLELLSGPVACNKINKKLIKFLIAVTSWLDAMVTNYNVLLYIATHIIPEIQPKIL